MRDTLEVGLSHVITIVVPERLTVPELMPDVPSWRAMPRVLATSMLVALMEWAATELLLPYCEDGEQTVGVRIDMTHEAPTPPGMEVEIKAALTRIEGRLYDFHITARDRVELIGVGKHRRASIDRAKFDARLQKKIARL